jgi:hypothetical protein
MVRTRLLHTFIHSHTRALLCLQAERIYTTALLSLQELVKEMVRSTRLPPPPTHHTHTQSPPPPPLPPHTCVCVCVYTYRYIYTHTHTTHKTRQAPTRPIRVCVRIYMCVCIHTGIYIRTHTQHTSGAYQAYMTRSLGMRSTASLYYSFYYALPGAA